MICGLVVVSFIARLNGFGLELVVAAQLFCIFPPNIVLEMSCGVAQL